MKQPAKPAPSRETLQRKDEEIKSLRKEIKFLRNQAAANLLTLVRLRQIFAAEEKRGDRARREVAVAQATTLLRDGGR